MPAGSRVSKAAVRHAARGIVTGMLMVLGLTGCGDDGDDRPSGPGPRPGPIPVTGLSAVCDGAFYPDGAAYQGPGPHPTQVYWLGVPGGSGFFSVSRLLDETVEITQPWADWARAEASTIQLVACESAGAATPTGATCEMSVNIIDGGGTKRLPLRAQSVVLTVHEVRTGRKVAEIPLDPSYECPAKYLLPSGQEWVIVKPSAEQVQKSLLPHVTADLPAATA